MFFERLLQMLQSLVEVPHADQSAARYRLIGFEPEVRISEIRQAVAMSLNDIANPDPEGDAMTVRESKIHEAYKITCIHSLQLMTIDDVNAVLQAGVDTAIDLFFGDWWKPEEELHSREDADQEIVFFNSFADGLLLAVLARRWEDVERISDWARQIDIANLCGVSQEIGALYAVIASGIRNEPTERADHFRSIIAKQRTKKTKILLQAWDAVVAQDAELLAATMRESLERFDKTVEKQGVGFAFTQLIAKPESVIYEIARRNGIELPLLPDNLLPYLVTRKSLGLDETVAGA